MMWCQPKQHWLFFWILCSSVFVALALARASRPNGADSQTLLDKLEQVLSLEEEESGNAGKPCDVLENAVGRYRGILNVPPRPSSSSRLMAHADVDGRNTGECDVRFEVCCWNGDVACRSLKHLKAGRCPHADEGILYLHNDWDDRRQCCSIKKGNVHFCPATSGSVFGCCKNQRFCKLGSYRFLTRECDEFLPYSPVKTAIDIQRRQNGEFAEANNQTDATDAAQSASALYPSALAIFILLLLVSVIHSS
eukprot:gnl/Spiro4/6051_TR3106_c0_g1_i1.p1 gnl/Spiro4/6051_TR3106_c0_g1~~gnl/Spiro4/6051_TR3106_c0_g1_i1.p1  ORF type:complete len:251 (-),score=33.71 gnl/Spiro4/6051_TR3106_c0_g1_i1:209-961(-)